MVPDSHGKLHRCKIQEEHVSVTDEPSGKYLAHFVPDDPLYPEKPAQKNAEALFDILESHGSVETLNFLGGDSTAMNTGYRGGTHAWLEKLIKRKLFWGICMIHTNELPLCHLLRNQVLLVLFVAFYQKSTECSLILTFGDYLKVNHLLKYLTR